MRFASALLDRVRGARPADRAGIAAIALVVLVSAGFVVAGRFHSAQLVTQAEVDRIGKELDAADPWEPRAEAADGGTVEVLEQGFAKVADSQHDSGDRYAVGFVLENTSRVDAVIPNIDFAVLDADGEEVTDAGATGGLENETIPPGGRVGVADTLYVGDGVDAEVSVSIGRSEWYLARPDIGAITTTRVETHGTARLTADIASEFDTAVLTPTVYVLFRDAEGRLLGGLGVFDAFGGSVPPGESRHELEFEHPPPKDSDMDATEVHVIYDRTIITF